MAQNPLQLAKDAQPAAFQLLAFFRGDMTRHPVDISQSNDAKLRSMCVTLRQCFNCCELAMRHAPPKNVALIGRRPELLIFL
jgi:hypothetical protein